MRLIPAPNYRRITAVHYLRRKARAESAVAREREVGETFQDGRLPTGLITDHNKL